MGPGDSFYNSDSENWEKVAGDRYGSPYDPSNSTPVRRQFHLPKGERPADVNLEKAKEKKFNFGREKKTRFVLAKINNKNVHIKFEPKRLSPSKDYVYIQHAEKLGDWMKISDLDHMAIEFLEGGETE